MEERVLKQKGKYLALLLRHDNEAFSKGLIDKNGWRSVRDLLDHGFSLAIIEEIVKTDEKNRYELSPDKTKIRARQGHSIPVDVGLVETTPPDVLYHGTATRFIDSILEKGILKGSRQYVHLSKNTEIAMDVGARHGIPVVFKVDAKAMHEDGIKFFLSSNKVWLVDYVDPKYISQL